MAKTLSSWALVACMLLLPGVPQAQVVANAPLAIYPIDRAQILSGQIFDFKIEVPVGADVKTVSVTINGQPAAKVLGQDLDQRTEQEASGVFADALWMRGVKLSKPGHYVVEARVGSETARVAWDVYGTGAKPIAKNVILMIGDGMTIANRTAARILSKGMTEGRYNGRLNMDDMPYTAMLGTSSVDGIATDSANSASAYTTGHKSSVNALGVYADRTKGAFFQPKVELISEIARRKRGMAIGIVTDAEVEDATPASMIAHTRRRAEKDFIALQSTRLKPEVLMGGGSAYYLPEGNPLSKRKDNADLVGVMRKAGYAVATTAQEMNQAARDPQTKKLLGLFHPENMAGSLDRLYLKGAVVQDYPDQPDGTEMAKAALDVLSRHPNGFVLMIEAGLIDKFSHVLDWERSVYDTIMLDRTIGVVKDWAAKRNDTLIIVTPDHTHPMSVVGVVDDTKKAEGRDKIAVYAEAGFPTYGAADERGYPPNPNVDRRLNVVYGAFPDYYETWTSKVDGPFAPFTSEPDAQGVSISRANAEYKKIPGATFREGNIPKTQGAGVHAVDDVVLSAMGPGADKFHGFMEIPRCSESWRKPWLWAINDSDSSTSFGAALALLAIPAGADEALRLKFDEIYQGRGALGASFAERVTQLQGKDVTMRGFMAPPLKAEAEFFVLTREPVALCPFCNSEADWPSNIVVVYPDGEQAWVDNSMPIEVKGRLEVGAARDPQTGFVSRLRLTGARFKPLG